MGLEGSALLGLVIIRFMKNSRDHLFLLEARDRSKGGVVQGSSSLCDEIE